MKLTVLYFAWLRERVGLPRETVETGAATVADLVEELRAREERYALAFSDLKSVRVALDQDLAISTRPWTACARWLSFRP
jgi:sulfur-carrier protein